LKDDLSLLLRASPKHQLAIPDEIDSPKSGYKGGRRGGRERERKREVKNTNLKKSKFTLRKPYYSQLWWCQ